MSAGGKRDEQLAIGLWRLLDERGMTQVMLAARAGIGKTTITNYINGYSGATLHKLRRIKAALGCTWEELLGE